jgi:hypothetical protein
MANNLKIEIDAHSNITLCFGVVIYLLSQFLNIMTHGRITHRYVCYLIAYLHLCIAIESCPITRDSAEVHSLRPPKSDQTA